MKPASALSVGLLIARFWNSVPELPTTNRRSNGPYEPVAFRTQQKNRSKNIFRVAVSRFCGGSERYRINFRVERFFAGANFLLNGLPRRI